MIAPVLTTARLILRPFAAPDAGDLERLAGAREVALNTLMIPHPYPPGEAEIWIDNQNNPSRPVAVFAITQRDDATLIGAIGLVISPEHEHGEIGYWIGVPFWGRGYATEAAGEVLRYAFETLKLNRIFAGHFGRNEVSGHVLKKLGMQHEGTRRQHFKKWGEYVDEELYAILRSDWPG